ncbi:MAG: hypothetical protein FD127_3342 [Acidimicrobiaceae bacterium]|nr:MAG: hypothetical protein FD127_3342 [Acidimicrobiaceae bacterium]
MNYDDSIVYPGQAGRAHLHTYFGNTASDAASSPASLLASGNSTCGGIANRSSYWVPSVINASNQAVVPIWNMVYYKSGYQGVAPSQISSTLPNGLKIIAGSALATSAQTAPARWACADSGGAYTPEQYSIPACQPGDTLKMHIQFPQCWDGINLDSADHKSHMAYGTGGVGCPSSHRVALPAISYNIDFPVGAAGTTGWKLASDTYLNGPGSTSPGGYSLHADIIIAWDPAVSSQWLNNCTRSNADCHVGVISDTQQIG